MINETQIQRLELLTQVLGISGDERDVAQALQKMYQAYTDDIVYDNLGSIFAIKKSQNPHAKTVMLMGHMDEVGFVVKRVLKNGLLRISPIGGWWSQTLLAQRVLVKSQNGHVYAGAIGSIPPHNLSDADRAKPMDIDKMLVDIGCTSEDEVSELGIRAGSPIVVDGPFRPLNQGQRLMAKAFDNRYGCALGVEILDALKDQNLPYHLVVGASVQEEVGLRGAETASYMIQPDIAIIFDCSPANDAFDDKEGMGHLGQGPLVRFLDRSYLPHRGFLNLYVDVMKAKGIPHQYYQSMGGTDAGIVHKQFKGIPTLTLCICARYIHTNSSIIDVQDYAHALQASLAVLEQLNDDTIELIRTANQ
jgi:glutamyl aminopeptidase